MSRRNKRATIRHNKGRNSKKTSKISYSSKQKLANMKEVQDFVDSIVHFSRDKTETL